MWDITVISPPSPPPPPPSYRYNVLIVFHRIVRPYKQIPLTRPNKPSTLGLGI